MDVTSSVDQTLATAAIKLCKTTSPELFRLHQGLAVIGQRFGLNITDGHIQSVTYQQKAVQSHLSVYLETSSTRIWPRTIYPSEPLLSCAAARLLHEGQFNLCDGLYRVQAELQGGLIDKVQRVGLVGRLLLLLAKDLHVRSMPGLALQSCIDWKTELLDCKRVPVVDFLEFLFGAVLEDDAKQRFEHWHVNFSHWISMRESIEFQSTDRARYVILSASKVSSHLMSSEWTLRHWCRTSAVQGCPDQPMIDQLIPMFYYDPAAEQTVPHRVSHILVLDRVQGENGRSDLLSITTRGSIGCSTSEPYIAMLLDLNATDQPAEVIVDSDGSCMRIYAPGMTSSTYPQLDSKVLWILSGMLVPREKSEGQRCREQLREQVYFGSTIEAVHMEWEAGRQGGLSSY